MAKVDYAEKRPAARVLAEILRGSWRSQPPELTLPIEDVEGALPLVARTNAAALAWWRLRQTNFAELPSVEALHDTYRYGELQATLHEARLLSVIGTLRSASIEPILMKGWDAARLYPRTGLRPYEDVDLLVRPDDRQRAEAALQTGDVPGAIVDFDHAEISVFDNADWNGLYARSRIVELGISGVRVLSPEDHLRAICLHGLKHCFSNPIWLCDIAVSVEAAGDDFDWARCVGASRPQDQWIGCALGLARELLGCELPAGGLPYAAPLPSWLVPVVLDAWIRWALAGPDERWAVRELWENPSEALAVVARRWPNQLVVTLKRRVPLTDGPVWLQRFHEFGYLFEGTRLVEALGRTKPQRSTP